MKLPTPDRYMDISFAQTLEFCHELIISQCPSLAEHIEAMPFLERKQVSYRLSRFSGDDDTNNF